jgi:hypothetical protein
MREQATYVCRINPELEKLVVFFLHIYTYLPYPPPMHMVKCIFVVEERQFKRIVNEKMILGFLGFRPSIR